MLQPEVPLIGVPHVDLGLPSDRRYVCHWIQSPRLENKTWRINVVFRDASRPPSDPGQLLMSSVTWASLQFWRIGSIYFNGHWDGLTPELVDKEIELLPIAPQTISAGAIPKGMYQLQTHENLKQKIWKCRSSVESIYIPKIVYSSAIFGRTNHLLDALLTSNFLKLAIHDQTKLNAKVLLEFTDFLPPRTAVLKQLALRLARVLFDKSFRVAWDSILLNLLTHNIFDCTWVNLRPKWHVRGYQFHDSFVITEILGIQPSEALPFSEIEFSHPKLKAALTLILEDSTSQDERTPLNLKSPAIVHQKRAKHGAKQRILRGNHDPLFETHKFRIQPKFQREGLEQQILKLSATKTGQLVGIALDQPSPSGETGILQGDLIPEKYQPSSTAQKTPIKQREFNRHFDELLEQLTELAAMLLPRQLTYEIVEVPEGGARYVLAKVVLSRERCAFILDLEPMPNHGSSLLLWFEPICSIPTILTLLLEKARNSNSTWNQEEIRAISSETRIKIQRLNHGNSLLERLEDKLSRKRPKIIEESPLTT